MGDLGSITWVGKIPWRRERPPTPVFWPGEFHGLYSPWGHKESDMTERLSLSFGVGTIIPILHMWKLRRRHVKPSFLHLHSTYGIQTQQPEVKALAENCFIANNQKAGLAIFICEESDGNCLRLCRPNSLSQLCSAVLTPK